MSYVRKKFLKYANKTQIHRISYILDGATLPKDTRYVFTEEDTFTLPIPIKKGYTFIEWQTTDGKKVDALPKGTNVTYAAKFQPVLNVVAAMTSAPASGGYYKVNSSATFTVTIRNTTNRIINNIILTNETNGSGAMPFSSSIGKVDGNRYVVPSLAIGQEVAITVEQVIDRKDAITGGNKTITNNININYDGDIDVKAELPNIKAERMYILTIKYIYDGTGEEAAPSRVSNFLEGEAYSYMSPVVSGYNPKPSSVKGIMQNKDLTIEVIYNKRQILPPTPTEFTFNIYEIEYSFELGMNWRQWVDSSYNRSKFYINSNGYVRAAIAPKAPDMTITYYIISPTGVRQKADMLIEPNSNYTTGKNRS